MGKMKVYELAKELNIQSKDIVNYLKENGIEGKVAQSALEDDAVSMVKKKFGAAKEAPKTEVKAEAPKAEAPKAEATVTNAAAPDEYAEQKAAGEATEQKSEQTAG